MLPASTGKILRELCAIKGPTSQSDIARAVGCSRSLVAKVVRSLEKKRYVHRPTRTTVAVANRQYLILYWAFRRDLEDDPWMVSETSLGTMELEGSLGTDIVFTAFSAARIMGAYETPYSDVYAYDPSGGTSSRGIPGGRRSRLHLLTTEDEHLRSIRESKEGLATVPVEQAYVDLLSIGTWEAKYAAMSLSRVDPHLPLIGSRAEMGEYL